MTKKTITYDDDARQACFLAACERAEAAMEVMADDANAYYFHALNLGRYSQSISVVKALGEGIGGKLQSSLGAALELDPDHAEAHTAMGMYHAEIIDKVGKMVGRMTYGASADEALAHFQRAIELDPGMAPAYADSEIVKEDSAEKFALVVLKGIAKEDAKYMGVMAALVDAGSACCLLFSSGFSA